MISNDFDLSYASLSSLSVYSLLGSDIDKLRHKYHRALEIKHVSLIECQYIVVQIEMNVKVNITPT